MEPTSTQLTASNLDDLGVIAVRGADARKFLQGQLSQDVLGLRDDRVEWAGLHNPQGRVITLLRLVPVGPTDVLCVLPRELAPATVTGLRKYLLRAKATVTDDSAEWRLTGLDDDAQLPSAPGSARSEGERILWRHASDGRVLQLAPLSAGIAAEPGTAAEPGIAEDGSVARAAWRLADIRAGIPEITLRTSGEFVAQMLNLDALGGISFTKGCYTGQEVIARAHYRGRVKRRAQRFAIATATVPAPGEDVTLADGRGARVVLAEREVDGGVEILAVTTMIEGDPLALPMSYTLPE